MMTNFDKVGEFHRKFGLASADQTLPTLVDAETFLFRYQFIMEEAQEILKAYRDGDIVELADGIADLLYVTYGLAHMCGIPADAVFAEVQRSNMMKERATGSDDHRGKRNSALDVVKPVGWKPPNIREVIDAHYRSFK